MTGGFLLLLSFIIIITIFGDQTYRFCISIERQKTNQTNKKTKNINKKQAEEISIRLNRVCRCCRHLCHAVNDLRALFTNVRHHWQPMNHRSGERNDETLPNVRSQKFLAASAVQLPNAATDTWPGRKNRTAPTEGGSFLVLPVSAC